MMKCKKGLVAGVVAVCMMGAMGSTSVFAVTGTDANTTDSAEVKYVVNSGYEWTIHSAIDFGTSDGAKVNTTVEKENNVVSVTKNVIPDGKKLVISVMGSDGESKEFKIANGNTKLDYKITKANVENATAIAVNGTVLEVAAGTNTSSQNLTFTLTTGSGSSEVAGTYSGKVTYTAEIK